MSRVPVMLPAGHPLTEAERELVVKALNDTGHEGLVTLEDLEGLEEFIAVRKLIAHLKGEPPRRPPIFLAS